MRYDLELAPSYMYILRCADDTLYVGSTTNIDFRLQQHNDGRGSAYTRRRRPVELVYKEEFASVTDAFAREKQVQGWSRAKRDALIAGHPVRANMPTYWQREKDAARRARQRRGR